MLCPWVCTVTHTVSTATCDIAAGDACHMSLGGKLHTRAFSGAPRANSSTV
jgi:hypothetical protein